MVFLETNCSYKLIMTSATQKLVSMSQKKSSCSQLPDNFRSYYFPQYLLVLEQGLYSRENHRLSTYVSVEFLLEFLDFIFFSLLSSYIFKRFNQSDTFTPETHLMCHCPNTLIQDIVRTSVLDWSFFKRIGIRIKLKHRNSNKNFNKL